MPGPTQEPYLNLSFASRMTKTTFQVLSQPPITLESSYTTDRSSNLTDGSQVDRSLVTPKIVRLLLGQYNVCIKPEFDILPVELLNHDGLILKKLPMIHKFYILVACAIAAARETYRSPSWKIYAQVCRTWANDFVAPIISMADADSLTAVLLLLIYELADPSRGIAWELLDIAVRTCLQLGWHRPNPLVTQRPTMQDQNSVPEASLCSQDHIRLLSALYSIQGSLQTVFNRPSLLKAFDLPIQSELKSILKIHAELSHLIYDSGQLHDQRGCPFVGDVAKCMARLETHRSEHPILQETWLLFLPVCVEHKQCLHCFQEADDSSGKGMGSLREHIIHTSSQLISSVDQAASARNGFIPPILATTRAFVAGCAIVTGISKQWASATSHMKDLIRCTEILSLFAPHWEGGQGYLHVWRSIVDLVNSDKPRSG